MKNKKILVIAVILLLILALSLYKKDIQVNNSEKDDVSTDNTIIKDNENTIIENSKDKDKEISEKKEVTIAKYEKKGICFNADATILTKYPESIEDEEFIVPNFIKVIGSEAFKGNKYLKKIMFPEGLTTIEYYAFTESNIEEINIAENTSNIGQFVFMDCTKLTTVHASDKMIDKILKESLSCNTFTNTPFAENYAKKCFVESGKQAILDSYSTVKPYNTSIKYKTNYSANIVNGGLMLDDDSYIYYIKSYSLWRIDKQGKINEQLLSHHIYKIFLYNNEIYYLGKDSFNEESKTGVYLFNKTTLETSLILEVNNDGFVINHDIIFYTCFEEDKISDANQTGVSLYLYNMNSKEKKLIDVNLADNRYRENIIYYENQIIYSLDNNNGEKLMQYDISTSKSSELIASNESIIVLGGFTSANLQIYNNELYGNFNSNLLKTELGKNILWKEILPRLDNEGHIYKHYVTDNYIFFFASYFSYDYNIHDFHVFRIKHDGSEITNIYNSKQHGTDGGSTGCYTQMFIIEDKIFLYLDVYTVLDFDGNVLDWNM